MTDDRDAAADRLRIDRWLWCARFYKSRSAAAEAVRSGHVRLNGQRVKSAHPVKIGDALRVSDLPKSDRYRILTESDQTLVVVSPSVPSVAGYTVTSVKLGVTP